MRRLLSATVLSLFLAAPAFAGEYQVFPEYSCDDAPDLLSTAQDLLAETKKPEASAKAEAAPKKKKMPSEENRALARIHK